MKTLRQALDRIEELEGILGLKQVLPNRLGLTETHTRIVGILLNRPIVKSETLFTLLYGHLPEAQQPTNHDLIAVHIANIRRRLRKHGIALNTQWGQGYYFDADTKAQLRDIMRVDAERQIERGNSMLRHAEAAA